MIECSKCHIEKNDNEFRRRSRQCRSCMAKCAVKWRQQNHAHVAAYNIKYSSANRLRIAAHLANYRSANRAQIQARNAQRYINHPGKMAAAARAHRSDLKKTAIDQYGGACKCCGTTNTRVLCIDHINGDGREHREDIGVGGILFWLKANNYPPNFRLLCFNCNIGVERVPDLVASLAAWAAQPNIGDVLRIEKVCGSKLEKDCIHQRNLRAKRRRMVIESYGGRCAYCAESYPHFLTVDHVHNDGAVHRSKNPNSHALLRMVCNAGFPDTFQLLCWNCNFLKWLSTRPSGCALQTPDVAAVA